MSFAHSLFIILENLIVRDQLKLNNEQIEPNYKTWLSYAGMAILSPLEQFH